jgi:PAS domain S-box-containing protein
MLHSKSPARHRASADAKFDLRKAEEWLRVTAHGFRIGLWYWNERKQEAFWDAKSRELFGVSDDVRITFDTLYNALHPDDRERVTRHWRYQLEHGLPYDIEYRAIRPDGSMRWLHSRGSGFYNKAGKPRYMLGVVFDVTEQKKAELERTELAGRLINAREREGMRLARELHDDFGQRLVLVSLGLEQVARMIDDSQGAASAKVRELKSALEEIETDLHSLSHRLHSSKLEMLGLAKSVESYCAEFAEKHAIQVDLDCIDLPRSIPSETSLCLLRIVQEALCNVSKHSGAPKAQVRLKGNSGEILLTIRDKGKGFDSTRNRRTDGIGIQSMRERARMLGGMFEVRSKPGGGTEIAVTIPPRGAPASRNGAKSLSRAAGSTEKLGASS